MEWGEHVDVTQVDGKAGLVIICFMMMMMKQMMIIMAYQHIPTSHIPTRWEFVNMMKGGNMTQSHSHHV